MATPGALENISADDLIEQIYNGAVPAKLAADLGVHKCSIYRHLANHPHYAKAREIGMAVRLDEVEQAVTDANERTLPRERERWRCLTWRAEREHPDRWGQKSANITINNNVLAISDSLVGQAGELLSQLRVCNTVAVTPVQQVSDDE